MKREMAFTILAMICGAILSLSMMEGLLLSGMRSPTATEHPLVTWEEKAEFDSFAKSPWWKLSPTWQRSILTGLFAVIPLALSAVGFWSFLWHLNPNWVKASPRWKGKPLVVSMLVLLSVAILLLVIVSASISMGMGIRLLHTLALVIFFGLLWFIAGEMGWAGDYSSWKMGVPGKIPRPGASFLMGATVGLAASGLIWLDRWAIGQWMFLASEVLPKTFFLMRLPFRNSCYGMAAVVGMSFGIFAGLAAALSPRYLETKQRLRRFLLPSILFGILIAVIAGVYLRAANRYELGGKSLAEALRVPAGTSVDRTVVLFKAKGKPGELAIQRWPMESSVTTLFPTPASYTMGLTLENLCRVEEYLSKKKSRTRFSPAAIDLLRDGYYRLWDLGRFRQWEFFDSEWEPIRRNIFLNYLEFLPIIPANRSYLESYANENKWYASGKGALQIAKGFSHFGMREEAERWLGKARERGADISSVHLPSRALTEGKVKGRIRVNGKPPSNSKVLLLAYVRPLEELRTSPLLGSAQEFVEAQELDAEGRFAFSNLYEGEFLLALMTEKETLPFALAPSRIKVRNAPGIIKLTGQKPTRTLGEIGLVAK